MSHELNHKKPVAVSFESFWQQLHHAPLEAAISFDNSYFQDYFYVARYIKDILVQISIIE